MKRERNEELRGRVISHIIKSIEGELHDWGARWDAGQIGFHQADVSDLLSRYAEKVWGSGGLGRVLVPLCGKSLDMVYLAERADAVVGVEYAEVAVTDFFAEQDLVPRVNSGPPQAYSDDTYTLYVADFFDVAQADVGKIDSVFDRASLVALEPEVRIRYAAHLTSLVASGSKALLITFDYDETEMNGPPFAVPGDEVHSLFGDAFSIENLETREVMNEEFRSRGLTSMTESVFAMTRR